MNNPYGRLGSIYSEYGLNYAPFMRSAAEVKRMNVDLDRHTEAITRNMASHWERYGRTLSLAVTAPLVAIGTQMTWTFANFEQSMARTAAVAQATEAELAAMTRTARELGATTQFSATQAAEGMTFLAMAGFNANQVISAMPGVLQLAAVAQMDLADAADITTNILTGYGLAVEELARVNDVLTAALTGANVDLMQLGEAMKYAGPVASAAGIEFEDAAAAIALMGNAGVQGSMAGTSLRGALTRLLNPTGQVRDLIRELGLNIYDTNGNLVSMIEIVAELERSGASAGDMMVLFGQRAGPAMQALVDQGSYALAQFVDRLRESEGIAERVAEQQMDTLRGSILVLKSAYDELSLSLAENVAPSLRGVFETGAQLLVFLAELPAPIQTGTTAVLALTAALGPLTLGIRGLVAAFGFLTGPFGIIAAVSAGLVGLGVGMATAKREQEDLHNRLMVTARGYRDQATELDRLIQRYEQLAGKPEKSKEEHDELEKVMKRIAELQPGLVAGYDDLSEALERNIDPIKRYVEALRNMTDESLRAAAKAAELRLPTLESQLQELQRRQAALQSELLMTEPEAVRRPIDALLEAWDEAQRQIREGVGIEEALAPVRELLRSGEIQAAFSRQGLFDPADMVDFAYATDGMVWSLRDVMDFAAKIREEAETLSGHITESFRDPGYLERISSELEQVNAEILETEANLKAVQAAISAWEDRQAGRDPFGDAGEVTYQFTPFAANFRAEADEVEETMAQALQRENELWQARIRLVSAGVEEYIREFGSLQDVTRSYLDWLRVQITDPAMEEEVANWLADALVGAQQDLDAWKRDIDAWFEEERSKAEAAGEGEERLRELRQEAVRLHEQAKAAHEERKKQILTEAELRRNELDVLRAGLATSIQQMERELEKIVASGPRTVDLRVLGGPEAVSAEIERIFDSFGPFADRFRQLFHESLIPAPENLEEAKRSIDNFWSHLLATGQVSAEEHAQVLEHQLGLLSRTMSTLGSDEWLQKSIELHQVLQQLDRERQQALLDAMEARAALAEEEGRILDAQIQREELQHQQRLAALEEGSEAYELEAQRHEQAVINIRKQASDELDRILAEVSDRISAAYDTDLQAKLRAIDLEAQADQKRLRGLGATEAQISQVMKAAEAEKLRITNEWRERRRFVLEQAAIETLRAQGKAHEAELRALELRRDQDLLEAANDEELKLEIQRRYAAQREDLIKRQTEAEEKLVKASQDRLAALHQTDLERQLAQVESERKRRTDEAQDTIQDALRLQTTLSNIEAWAAKERTRIRQEFNVRQQAEAERFAADMAAIQGRAFDADIHRIEAERLTALITATTDEQIKQIEALAEARRRAAMQAEADRVLQERLAEIDREAYREELAPSVRADLYEEALAQANKMFEGITVSARLAADTEKRILDTRRQSYRETFRQMVEDIERKAEREAWSSGRLAEALEQEALMYAQSAQERQGLEDQIWRLQERQRQENERREAEYNQWLVATRQKSAREVLEAQVRAAEEHLRVLMEAADDEAAIAAARMDLDRAEHELNQQIINDDLEFYRIRSELGRLSTEERIQELEELLDKQREFYGDSAEFIAEHRQLLIELRELRSQHADETAEEQIAEILRGQETLGNLYNQRDALVRLAMAWQAEGETGEAAVKLILAALEDVDAKINEIVRNHPFSIFTDQLHSVAMGDRTLLEGLWGTWGGILQQEVGIVFDDVHERMARFIEFSTDSSHTFGTAWKAAFDGFQLTGVSAFMVVVNEIINLFTAASNARDRLMQQAKTDRERRIEDEKRFAELVAAGFTGTFETSTKVYQEQVAFLFGLFRKTITHTEKVTAEETQAWMERMTALLRELQQVGQNALREAFRYSPEETIPNFLQSLNQGIYDSVLSGLTKAFSEHQIYTRAMAPLFQSLDEAIEAAFAGGTFDDDLFWQHFRPAFEQFQDQLEQFEGPVAAMRRVLEELRGELDLPDITQTRASTGGTRLTTLTGSSRDFFAESLRPIQMLDLWPQFHEHHMRRLDIMIELMRGGALEGEFSAFVRMEAATIHSETVIVEMIQQATFTGPIGTVVAQIGEEDAGEFIGRSLDRFGSDGDAYARAEGN